MQIPQPLLLSLLLCCYPSANQANRVYVHPFNLFAAENVSCVSLQTQPSKPLQTVPVAPLEPDVLTPDSKDVVKLDGQRESVTERTMALAGLVNILGLRMYEALSKRHSTNTLLSPVNTCGTLVNFYLGASKITASTFQVSHCCLNTSVVHVSPDERGCLLRSLYWASAGTLTEKTVSI